MWRASALRGLAQALAQAQHWDAARATADAIPEARERAGALSALVAALARAQHWEAARATADAIPDAAERAGALVGLTQVGSLTQTTTLLIEVWPRAQTRDELLRLFAITPGLLRAAPEIGPAFLDSFAWVDVQLAVG